MVEKKVVKVDRESNLEGIERKNDLKKIDWMVEEEQGEEEEGEEGEEGEKEEDSTTTNPSTSDLINSESEDRKDEIEIGRNEGSSTSSRLIPILRPPSSSSSTKTHSSSYSYSSVLLNNFRSSQIKLIDQFRENVLELINSSIVHEHYFNQTYKMFLNRYSQPGLVSSAALIIISDKRNVPRCWRMRALVYRSEALMSLGFKDLATSELLLADRILSSSKISKLSTNKTSNSTIDDTNTKTTTTTTTTTSGTTIDEKIVDNDNNNEKNQEENGNDDDDDEDEDDGGGGGGDLNDQKKIDPIERLGQEALENLLRWSIKILKSKWGILKSKEKNERVFKNYRLMKDFNNSNESFIKNHRFSNVILTGHSG